MQLAEERQIALELEELALQPLQNGLRFRVSEGTAPGVSELQFGRLLLDVVKLRDVLQQW